MQFAIYLNKIKNQSYLGKKNIIKIVKFLVIIPTFNEYKNISIIYKRIINLYKKADILFIDDNSSDGSQKEIIGLKKKDKRVNYIFRDKKLGIGSAHKFALKWGYKHKYKIIVTMDCDGTHHPKHIKKMIDILTKKKFDIVSTNRFLKVNSLKEWSLWRKFLTTLRYLVINKVLDIRYDSSGAFRCYNSSKIRLKDLLKAKNDSYSFFWESIYLLDKKKYSIFEIPIDLPGRLTGSSKMQFKDIFLALYYLLMFYFKKN